METMVALHRVLSLTTDRRPFITSPPRLPLCHYLKLSL